MNEAPLFIGTYTNGNSSGIYRLHFNTETGALGQKTLMAKMENPSFLAISKDKKHLFAVSEVNTLKDNSGGVQAFTITADSLLPNGKMEAVGAHPCHLSLSDDDALLAVSNYSGGNSHIFTLTENGKLQTPAQVLDFQALDSTRTSHAHMAEFTSQGVFISDLGRDVLYRFQQNEGLFIPHVKGDLTLAKGAGPRHFVFSKDQAHLYVINELNSTITIFTKTKRGQFTERNTVTTLAEDFKGESYCADIHLSADGNFLYASNRGENTLAIFRISTADGSLTPIGRKGVRGDWPRNFTLDQSGKYILVANQKSQNITVFRRNPKTGLLTYVQQTAFPHPVCLVFL